MSAPAGGTSAHAVPGTDAGTCTGTGTGAGPGAEAEVHAEVEGVQDAQAAGLAEAHAEAARALAVRSRRTPSRHAALGLAVPALLLLVWQAAGQAGVVNTVLFPPPSRIAVRTADLASTGELGSHATATLGRLLPGYGLGAAAAALAGFVMGASRTARAAFGPLFSAL